MKRQAFFIIYFTVCYFLVLALPEVNGQISHGGQPLMNARDYTASKVLYVLPPEDSLLIDGLKKNLLQRTSKAQEFATIRPIDLSPESNGEWVEKDDMSIWRVHIISPNAYSIGLLFSEYNLSDDARLFVYDPDGAHVKGGFTAENDKDYGTFYIGHVPGDEIVVELQVANPFRDYGKLRISNLSHAFLPVFSGTKNANDQGLGTSQECEIDVNCIEGEDWQIVKRAVCLISTPQVYCTGTLINNTSYNGKPYVLTAEHCINKDFSARNSIFYFDYENSKCFVNDALPGMSVSGSTLLSTGDSLDFSLVNLSARPPHSYNVYYAGWDIRTLHYGSSYALHFPNGDAMKLSIDEDHTSDAKSLPGDLVDYVLESNFHIKQWDLGTTEGGSSGCPLFNSSKRIIGILSGGLASCGAAVGYDAERDRIVYSKIENTNDYFSKLSFDWDYYSEADKQLKKWLDPINTGHKSIGGLNNATLGLAMQLSDARKCMIFPNPVSVSEEAQIALPEYTGDPLTITVYNITGAIENIIYTRSEYPVTISFKGISPGLYILRMESESAYYTNQVLVR
ncbi:T9SS type A sorting domain-containing protein [Bacteroidota bacterium]